MNQDEGGSALHRRWVVPWNGLRKASRTLRASFTKTHNSNNRQASQENTHTHTHSSRNTSCQLACCTHR
jgi:hypothetical protein